jgi:hypothetical protein
MYKFVFGFTATVALGNTSPVTPVDPGSRHIKTHVPCCISIGEKNDF